MRRAFFEATVARTHTLLFLARWVAHSSVGSRVDRRLPGRHSLVAARPLALPVWDFSCGAQRLGKAATLVSLKVVFCPGGTCWTRLLSSVWGD